MTGVVGIVGRKALLHKLMTNLEQRLLKFGHAVAARAVGAERGIPQFNC